MMKEARPHLLVLSHITSWKGNVPIWIAAASAVSGCPQWAAAFISPGALAYPFMDTLDLVVAWATSRQILALLDERASYCVDITN